MGVELGRRLIEWSVARDGGRFVNGWKREEYLVSKEQGWGALMAP